MATIENIKIKVVISKKSNCRKHSLYHHIRHIIVTE